MFVSRATMEPNPGKQKNCNSNRVQVKLEELQDD